MSTTPRLIHRKRRRNATPAQPPQPASREREARERSSHHSPQGNAGATQRPRSHHSPPAYTALKETQAQRNARAATTATARQAIPQRTINAGAAHPRCTTAHHNATQQERSRNAMHPRRNAATRTDGPSWHTTEETQSHSSGLTQHPCHRPPGTTAAAPAETRVAFSIRAAANATWHTHTPPSRIPKKPPKR